MRTPFCDIKSGELRYWIYCGIVLLAVISASYKFFMVDIGAQGRLNDGRIFKGSNMGQRFKNKEVDLPPPCPLSNHLPIPYMLVGDAAFQLTEYILRPYSSNQLNRPINASLKTTESIIKATVCLHNFLLSTRYIDMIGNTCQNVVQENTAAIRNVSNMGNNTHLRLAASIRNEFCEYFVEEGSISWQEMHD
ncbi:hypothetical protein ALC62_12641 [Cyphomyrmex costatus]|uniref:DDE Tnp4 domain-containing protein n=1 Tax=Cyphomyrmex costatus TaxID=456900 RepID=A0A151IAW7_9HYME|nr:hypothetical protein ALC62_12641 [Cyphomyrmex costatus]